MTAHSWRHQLYPEKSVSGEQLWKLGEDAVVLSRPPWQAAIPSSKAKATAVRFICSPGECGQLLIMAEAAGFSTSSNGLQCSTLITSSKLRQQLLERLRPWLSKETVGDTLDAMDDQLLFLRLQPGSCACFSKDELRTRFQGRPVVVLPLNRAPGAELRLSLGSEALPLADEQGTAILHPDPSDLEVSGGAQGVLHFLCVGFRDGEHQEQKHAPTTFQVDASSSRKLGMLNDRGQDPRCFASCSTSAFGIAPPALVPPPPAVFVDAPPMEVWPQDPLCELEAGDMESFWEPEKQHFDGTADGVSVASMDQDGVAQLPELLVPPRTMHWDTAD